MKIVWSLSHGFMAFFQSAYYFWRYLKRNMHKWPEYVFYSVIYIIWFAIPEGIVHLAKWCKKKARRIAMWSIPRIRRLPKRISKWAWSHAIRLVLSAGLGVLCFIILSSYSYYLTGYQRPMMIAINTDSIYLCIDQLKLVEDYTAPTNMWKYSYDYEKTYIQEVHESIHELRVTLEIYTDDENWSDFDRDVLLRMHMDDFKQTREVSFLGFKSIKVTPVPDLGSWPLCTIILEFKSPGTTGAGAAYDEKQNYFDGLIPPSSDSARSISMPISNLIN